MSASKRLTTVKELMDALKGLPPDTRLCVSCMDGTDVVYVRYEKQFKYVMVSG